MTSYARQRFTALRTYPNAFEAEMVAWVRRLNFPLRGPAERQ
jgi:hypothetical protein